MILAGDIGGTKVNLAFFEVAGQQVTQTVAGTYPSRQHASLEEIVREFLATHNLKVDYACFGIAGPVKKGRAQLTNLPWVVDVRVLTHELRLKHAWLVNDLEANAYGIAGLSPKDFVTLNQGDPEAKGNAAIISAGTGLGEAGLFWDGHRHLPLACEGGHSDFAPRTDLDVELFRHLRAQFGRVSWERVLSGPGAFNIYKFLRDTGRGEEPAWLTAELKNGDSPSVITHAGLEGKCELCVQVLDLFVTYYGTEASNLALKIMSIGGLYVGGGIAPKIINKLMDGNFMKAFCAAGRMRELMEAMPVRVILNDKTALIGAARLAAAQAGWIR
ncbi:MAG: glucokinase [Verrucomicrobia bacterium]|nr:glucokinase [Verrucomicrobiota bacterium]